MRKILILIAVIAVVIACNSNESTTTKTTEDTTSKAGTTATNDLSGNPDYQKGLEIEGRSDCVTCHRVDEKLNGPSYREIANKYAPAADTTIKRLAGKIKTGGSGVWGEVMMTPHPMLTDEERETLVRYVLLHKK